MSRGLGRDVPVLEKLYAKKHWVDFSFPSFGENCENDEFAFYPLETRVLFLGLPKTTKMTKMAGVTQEKTGFSKSRV